MNFTTTFRVDPDKKLDLSKIKAGQRGGMKKKADGLPGLAKNVKKLAELQYLLFAEGKRSLLIVLQAMDAGGKDGTVRHVMGPMNPASCKVHSFKVPTDDELAHDFLWRIHKATPRRGEIAIFNRSHYEDVLIARVHKLVSKKIWAGRYERINDFEALLADHDTHVLKFYLHISKEEQLRRLKRRIDDPNRHWKISPADFKERKYWDDYMAAFEDALSKTSTPHAPWFVVPADHKWFRNLAVSSIIVEKLKSLDMKFPQPAFDVSKIVVE